MADISKIKVNGTEYNVADSSARADVATLNTTVASKANTADVYSKSAVDTALGNKADTSTTYTKTEVDTALSSKADTSSIPTTIAQLTDDATHRTVTDAEKAVWDAKSSFDGDYNSLTNKPVIPTVPSKVSEFENDAGYITEHQDISGKQDTLESGINVKTINGNSILGSGNISIDGNNNTVKQYRMKCRINTEPNSTLDGYLIKNIHLPSNAGAYIRNALNHNPFMTYIQCPIYVDVTNIPQMDGEIIYTGLGLLLAPQMSVSPTEDVDTSAAFNIGMYFSASFYYDRNEFPVIFTMYMTDDGDEVHTYLIVKSLDVEQRMFLLDDNYQVFFDLPEAVIE